MAGWKERGHAVAIASVVVLLALGLRPVIVKIRRPSSKPRSEDFEVLESKEHADFEIVAVHGLGADPEYTWSHPAHSDSVDRMDATESTEPSTTNSSKRIHLLRDLLHNDFPTARILYFKHNSQWLTDAPVKRIEEIGRSLAERIKEKRPRPSLPIIFIGHSLGGIIIKQALCLAGSEKIVKDTSGIIFLGTPHHGSSLPYYGSVLALITSFLGSDTTLLLSLRSDNPQLKALRYNFNQCKAEADMVIVSYYETVRTKLLGFLPVGLVVSEASATEHASKGEEHHIDTDHSGLNKCAGQADELYKQLKRSIEKLKTPSPLQQADDYIRNNCYTDQRLEIERLSGKTLSMNQCYINLAIVEKPGRGAARQISQQTSASSLSARLRVETPAQETQIALSTMFEARAGADGKTIQPRKIWIRGRAGVGKTTLCKKIIHDFRNGKMWNERFDRVFWIPLRKLKQRTNRAGFNLKNLFYDEFFSPELNKEPLVEALYDVCSSSDRCLFILDGMDEIWHDLSPDSDMRNFMESLLRQPNIIVTARPSVTSFKGFHLDLETIGFYPHQVSEYIRNAEEAIASDIQKFIDSRPVIQGLVRIPIQLDAVCCAWNDVWESAPETMTQLYHAIEIGLGRKDIVRLDKNNDNRRVHPNMNLNPGIVNELTKGEADTVASLAFTGLYNDTIYFDPKCQHLVSTYVASDQSAINETLRRISYLRSSDDSVDERNRTYHFLHLTLQEYFAARYFSEKWIKREKLDCLDLSTSKASSPIPVQPIVFLQTHKYSARYDIFWRFVTGLLAAERDGAMIAEFFNEMHKEPLDLLGPTHQRLIMHCLSEVPSEKDLPCRPELEDGLKEWLLFEYSYRGEVNLAREMEFPEHALEAAFSEGSDDMKRAVLRKVSKRAGLPNTILETAASWFHHDEYAARDAAVQALGGRSDLPNRMLEVLASKLDDRDGLVRYAAVQALGGRSDLPNRMLEVLAAKLDDGDESVRRAAVDVLGGRSDLPDGMLEVLTAKLDDGDASVRYAAVNVLGGRSDLPDGMLEVLAAKLDDGDASVRWAAVRALGGRSDLPDGMLEVLAAKLDDGYDYVRHAAVEVLGGRSDLPDGILEVLAAKLDDGDVYARCAAVKVILQRRESFFDDILKDNLVASFYRGLLHLSFAEQLSWYIDGNDSCINMPEGIKTLPMSRTLLNYDHLISLGCARREGRLGIYPQHEHLT